MQFRVIDWDNKSFKLMNKLSYLPVSLSSMENENGIPASPSAQSLAPPLATSEKIGKNTLKPFKRLCG